MPKSIITKQISFYLWLGVGYFFLGLLATLGKYPGRLGAVVLNNLWGVSYLVMVNFLLFEYSFPFILRKRQSVIYNILIAIPAIFFHLMLYSYGAYAWRMFGILLHVYTALKVYSTLDLALENQMAFSMGGVVFFGIIRHAYRYIQLKQRSQQLLIEKQAAELSYLRSQTNPHFLFNTLNNIYSLSRDKSDLAPESILRLSKILRFMLYETSGAFIAIEQELKIITDYIDLEKLRYYEPLPVNFSYDVDDMKQALPPLLLIPLVENAFKHGISETTDKPFLDIFLSVKNRQLKFTVSNSVGSPGEQKVKENIGLSNLRRQLELLYRDYDLSVQHRNLNFTAILKINLASHV